MRLIQTPPYEINIFWVQHFGIPFDTGHQVLKHLRVPQEALENGAEGDRWQSIGEDSLVNYFMQVVRAWSTLLTNYNRKLVKAK